MGEVKGMTVAVLSPAGREVDKGLPGEGKAQARRHLHSVAPKRPLRFAHPARIKAASAETVCKAGEAWVSRQDKAAQVEWQRSSRQTAYARHTGGGVRTGMRRAPKKWSLETRFLGRSRQRVMLGRRGTAVSLALTKRALISPHVNAYISA